MPTKDPMADDTNASARAAANAGKPLTVSDAGSMCKTTATYMLGLYIYIM